VVCSTVLKQTLKGKLSVYDSMMDENLMQPISYFELFAGYGGGGFSLNKANIPSECVGFSEIKPHAVKCFEANHKGVKGFGDCTQIDPSKLPDFDLLTAGFPCQPFSSAGKQKGELDIRGTLFNEIIRIAEVKTPKYMLLENVRGLTFRNMKDTFDKILSELDRIGYTVYWKILNSKHYGSPQNRQRVFFVCFRKDLEITEFTFPEPEELTIYLKDIVEPPTDTTLVSVSWRNKNRSKHQQRGEAYGKYPNEYIYQYNKDIGVSFCIVSARHEFRVGTIEDLENARDLTPQECFRLMGFVHDEIDISGLTKTQQYDLAGNGWDINVVSKIFQQMFPHSIQANA
jgi:DNA (cytosine-5)-methyltransferase 1